MEVTINPILDDFENHYHVNVGEVCVADKSTPLLTHSLSTCSGLLVFDDNQSQHLMAHVMAGDSSMAITRTLHEHFNLKSKTLNTIIIPGTGYTENDGSHERPKLSLFVLSQALNELKYITVDDWYKDEQDFIYIHKGLIQKGDYISDEKPTESLPRGLICKPF